MALLGKAALAMWWDMAPEMRSEFEDWHSHEHFPERLGVPGFKRATRWAGADGGTGIFQMYELEAHETLVSPEYLARLNAPTPWSTKLMPYHANMVRSQARVVHSRGGGVARHALTVRMSPQDARAGDLHEHLRVLIEELVSRPGITGAHLLQTHTPAIPQTTEQKIRGRADQAADWIFVACGYDKAVLRTLGVTEFASKALRAAGAAPGALVSLHLLSLTMVPADLA
jgi:hypothetical protein